MANEQTRRVLYVFLASPGDLAEERTATRAVVDEVNAAVARNIGWTIELLAWEDTLPGFVRPQERINADVDICELFIGLLWRRWGQPTGKYSSGFEEEFERARDRHRSTKSPEIWILFKQLEADLRADPGEQLRNVIGFRDGLVSAKEIFSREFSDARGLAENLRVWLSRYVIQLAWPQSRAQGETQVSAETTSPTSPPANTMPESPGGTLSEAARQLGDALDGLSEALVRRDSEYVLRPEAKFDVARIYLGAAASMFRLRVYRLLGASPLR